MACSGVRVADWYSFSSHCSGVFCCHFRLASNIKEERERKLAGLKTTIRGSIVRLLVAALWHRIGIQGITHERRGGKGVSRFLTFVCHLFGIGIYRDSALQWVRIMRFLADCILLGISTMLGVSASMGKLL
jgi:hypothetical protein